MVWEGEGHAGKDEQALRREQVLSEHSYNMTCYDVHREFLENMKKRQEKKVNDLLEDNKELLESIKKKAAETKEVIEVRGREFDQMMEKTVCEAI